MKTIHKMGCRILVGLAILYPAYDMHDEANAISDDVIGVNAEKAEYPSRPRRTHRMSHLIKPQSRDAADFFSDDPREVVARPENVAILDEATALGQKAWMIGAVGLAMILRGVWPLFRPVLGPVIKSLVSQCEAKANEADSAAAAD